MDNYLIPFSFTFKGTLDRASMMCSYPTNVFLAFDDLIDKLFGNKIVRIRPDGKYWYACAYRPTEDSDYHFVGVFLGNDLERLPSFAKVIDSAITDESLRVTFVEIEADGLSAANALMINFKDGRV